MTRILTRALGRHAAKHARKAGWLDARLGFSMMRDRRVPVGTKLISLALGLGLTFFIVSLEIPLELVLGGIMPFVGAILDVGFDGLEFLMLPVIFGSIILTHLAKPLPID